MLGQVRQEELIVLGAKVAGLAEVYDKLAQDAAAMDTAAASFDDLLQVKPRVPRLCSASFSRHRCGFFWNRAQ